MVCYKYFKVSKNGLINIKPMFLTSKLSFDEDMLGFLTWQVFWLLFNKLGQFFSKLLVTLATASVTDGDIFAKQTPVSNYNCKKFCGNFA
jgi:hypothetical protein